MIYKGNAHGNVLKIPVKSIKNQMFGCPVFTITGGEFAVVHEEKNVGLHTILGSCVSIVLYDKRQKVKGLNHFLLPSNYHGKESYRYGLHSVETMLNEMLKLGCEKEHISAKISGGAKVLNYINSNIGEKNVQFAREYCKKEGIPILAESVFGNYGRAIVVMKKLEIMTRKIQNKAYDEIIAKEEELSVMLSKETVSSKTDNVTLWD